MIKRNLKKLILAVSAAAVVFTVTVSPALAGTWEYAGDDYAGDPNNPWKYWKYKYDDGTYAKNCVIEENGVTYEITSPKYSDGKNLDDFGVSTRYGWRNIDKVRAMSDEIYREDKQNGENGGTPIAVISCTSAIYQGTVGTTSMWLRREADGSCELEIYVGLKSERNKKGLLGLTHLMCDDDTLYDALYTSFTGDETIYGINYDDFIQVGNFLIKAELGQGKHSIIFIIKENEV